MNEYRSVFTITPEEHDAYLDELLSDIDASPTDNHDGSATALAPETPCIALPETHEHIPTAAGMRVSPAISTPTPYQFPARDGGIYTGMSVDALKVTLQEKIEEGFKFSKHWDYDSVRRDLCMIHLELNRLARWAPRFRGMPRFPRGGKGDENAMLDRQVIDLNWLSMRYENHGVANRDYEDILRKPFDFSLAAAFACATWHPFTKATYLNLRPSMEWELSIIQSEAIRKLWLVLQDGDLRGSKVNKLGAKQVRSRLLEVARQKALVPNWVDTWTAAAIANQNWEKTAQMLALMTGSEAPAPRQVARTFASIRANLDKALRR